MGGQLKSVSLPRAPGINVFKPFRLPLWETGDTPSILHSPAVGAALLRAVLMFCAAIRVPGLLRLPPCLRRSAYGSISAAKRQVQPV